MLNAELDIDLLSQRFHATGRLQIANVLQPEVAERIREYCMSDVPYKLVHFRDGRNHAWASEDVAGKTQADMQKIQQDIWREARNGVGFQYGGYMMRQADKHTSNEKLAYLHSVFEFINGDEMLKLINRVTRRADLQSADAQFTRFLAGQFLTRHRDVVRDRGRRVAYVLGFSKHWHPDWGGLLQFYAEDGTPEETWVPQFNCLNLFDIQHIHAVTFVTPFAGDPRLSLTGWFRSTPRDQDP